MPHVTAVFLVSILVLFNFGTCLAIADFISGRTLLRHIGFGKVFAVTSLAIIIAINYFVFLKGDRYKKLTKQFESETSCEKNRRLIFCLIYVFGSFLGFWGLLFVLAGR
jgi:hypothetical protein